MRYGLVVGLVVQLRIAAAACAAVLATQAGCRSDADAAAAPPPPPVPPRVEVVSPARRMLELPARVASAGMVGSRACGSCHVQNRWQADHHMAQTSRRVDAGDQEVWFSDAMLGRSIDPGDPGIARYRRTADGVFLVAATGARLPVAAVFGSMHHMMTPIAVVDGAAPAVEGVVNVERGDATRGRRIVEMLTSFYGHIDSWGATPGMRGEEPGRTLGEIKPPGMTDRCVRCHMTEAVWRDDTLDLDASTFGIQCERCHGPGGAHVGAALEEGSERQVFNPGRLRPDDQVYFCAQCHRQPGMMSFVGLVQHGSRLARHAGASLMLSECFRKSPPEATVSCLDCHDPHRNVERAAVRALTQQVCLRCHGRPERLHRSPGWRAADCASCHMPEKDQAEHDRPGVLFADHWIGLPDATPPVRDPVRLRELIDYFGRYLADPRTAATLDPDDLANRRMELHDARSAPAPVDQAQASGAPVFSRTSVGLTPGAHSTSAKPDGRTSMTARSVMTRATTARAVSG